MVLGEWLIDLDKKYLQIIIFNNSWFYYHYLIELLMMNLFIFRDIVSEHFTKLYNVVFDLLIMQFVILVNELIKDFKSISFYTFISNKIDNLCKNIENIIYR